MKDAKRPHEGVAARFLWGWGLVTLGRFTVIDDAAAVILAQSEGPLRLGGLTALSDAAATALCKHEGEVDLEGLTALSDAAPRSHPLWDDALDG
jgi:hypothetical protein